MSTANFHSSHVQL